jgi:hypothetical protein
MKSVLCVLAAMAFSLSTIAGAEVQLLDVMLKTESIFIDIFMAD